MTAEWLVTHPTTLAGTTRLVAEGVWKIGRPWPRGCVRLHRPSEAIARYQTVMEFSFLTDRDLKRRCLSLNVASLRGMPGTPLTLRSYWSIMRHRTSYWSVGRGL